MRKIQIVCPVCAKTKRIKISEDVFNFDFGSLLKFPIKKNFICNHQFLVIMDYNFSVRDYEILNTSHKIARYPSIDEINTELYEFIPS